MAMGNGHMAIDFTISSSYNSINFKTPHNLQNQGITVYKWLSGLLVNISTSSFFIFYAFT